MSLGLILQPRFFNSMTATMALLVLSVFFSTLLSLTHASNISLPGNISQSAGCGKDLPVGWLPGQDSHNVTLPTTNRSYLIKLPSAYNMDTPAPVIFSFHGRGGTAQIQEQTSNFSVHNWNETAIAIYPQAVAYPVSLACFLFAFSVKRLTNRADDKLARRSRVPERC